MFEATMTRPQSPSSKPSCATSAPAKTNPKQTMCVELGNRLHVTSG